MDLLDVGAELHPLDDDAAALPILEPIDAAKERGLAAARRAADNDAFPPRDLEVDIPEHVKDTEPFVETGDLDRHRIIARVTVLPSLGGLRLPVPDLIVLSHARFFHRASALFKRRSMDRA